MDSPRPKPLHLARAIRKTFRERNDLPRNRARILPVRRIFASRLLSATHVCGLHHQECHAFSAIEDQVSGAKTDRYKVGQNPLSQFIATHLGTC
jgi:hypothetical protein